MAGLKSALLFVLQSIVVGLAVAFLAVLIRPDLLPNVGANARHPVASYADAVDQSAPAVASIYTKRIVEYPPADGKRPRLRIESNFGSAVVINSEGYLVTNYHVVAQAAEITVQLSDGQLAQPTVVGLDAETDLALLKVDLGTIPAMRLGRSADLRIGDIVLAIGNPYGLPMSVTQGIVSGTGRDFLDRLTTFQDFIQTDAAINSGNSGGALINVAGELVGINTAVLAQDPNTEGISFAIPVDLVRGVVEELQQHGRVIRGYMGLEPDDLTPAERAAMGIESDTGFLLRDVYEGGPAAEADLRPGDVILEINGQRISTGNQARLIVAGASPGDVLELVGMRDGEEFRKSVVAAERPVAPD